MILCFFGSSLVSSYWNGAATYYRGMLKALAARGVDVRFYEPDAYDRQRHRDIPDPDWARVVVFPATSDGWRRSLEDAAARADILVKASGVGVFDTELEQAVPQVCATRTISVFWDVDAPATLETIDATPHHHLRVVIPRYDAVLTYGGGSRVVSAYRSLGAARCVPIYNGLDPHAHRPLPRRADHVADLGFLGNRLPDREARADEFFFRAAALRPTYRFVLGGAGWDGKAAPANVRRLGHVGTEQHDAFYASSRATLNVNRDSMARFGHSPATRMFEAAGCGACIVSDAWEGLDEFFEPGREVIPVASGDAVADVLDRLDPDTAYSIGAAARRRALADHTYDRRAQDALRVFDETAARREVVS